MGFPYDARFLKGVLRFNNHEFFEAHEAWEELWMDVQGSSRQFYKGLIQVAVCLHHFGNGNTRGARKLFLSSREYLSDYCPRYGGIDLDQFLAELEQCCRDIAPGEPQPPGARLDPDSIPCIQLQPPAEGTVISGTE